MPCVETKLMWVLQQRDTVAGEDCPVCFEAWCLGATRVAGLPGFYADLGVPSQWGLPDVAHEYGTKCAAGMMLNMEVMSK